MYVATALAEPGVTLADPSRTYWACSGTVATPLYGLGKASKRAGLVGQPVIRAAGARRSVAEDLYLHSTGGTACRQRELVRRAARRGFPEHHGHVRVFTFRRCRRAQWRPVRPFRTGAECLCNALDLPAGGRAETHCQRSGTLIRPTCLVACADGRCVLLRTSVAGESVVSADRPPALHAVLTAEPAYIQTRLMAGARPPK